jgi:hypothetical protein
MHSSMPESRTQPNSTDTKLTMITNLTYLTNRKSGVFTYSRVIRSSIVAFIAAAGISISAHADSTVTFNETQYGPTTGFNGGQNPYLLTADGLYRVEAFWLNYNGHFHTYLDASNNAYEDNHNNSGGFLPDLQGLRITTVSGQAFDAYSFDLLNLGAQIAISTDMNASTGAATWSLLSGAGTHNLGGAYHGITALYLADPGAAGGSSYDNRIDNIKLGSVSAVPEAGTALAGMGLVLVTLFQRRRSQRLSVH